ncbi:serine hydrolase domain-containing protein [Amycolatopsis umgeniensis]|uniref:CubicO group peptidase (Beta-lactamase class C family) n=1 Tax=Amycolatopsis umgeniensis TaxID=336628 RepID=A0A841BH11_9PSEU|nr:serine hydrolase domain-containing protein [Amycolatopsis umgeniensis]MBB5857842.1 CubicO group peptidase (beta-lactamase class C family) [Amycolatopsis umgeniensis]
MNAAPSFVSDEVCRKILCDRSFATGLSVAVTDREEVLSSGVFGEADKAGGSPVTEDTLFQIGSITKGFTCELLVRARDAGLVDLDSPVTAYLPWFSVRSSHGPITLRHLMTHTAGIIAGSDVSADATFEVWALRDTEATTPPGTWFHYSNAGYKALGLVLEAVHRRPYHEIVGDLLASLGMHASAPAITHDLRPRLAVGHEPRYDDRHPIPEDGVVPATWIETATADGCVAATARDMTAWLRLLIGREPGEMLTAAIPDEEFPGSAYGLGMQVGDLDGRPHAWHTGGMIGYYAAIACDLDAGIGAVVLANGVGPWQELAVYLAAEARAERDGALRPEFAPPPKKPAPPPAQSPPERWAAVVGHYRCHNPWLSNLHVHAFEDELWVSVCGGAPERLVPLPDGGFRVGADERSPERLRFDVVVDGVAIRADYSGCPLYRTFTP